MVHGGQFAFSPTAFKYCLCNNRAMYFNPVPGSILFHISGNLFYKFLFFHTLTLPLLSLPPLFPLRRLPGL
ncbi:hypothetical protein 1013_scaffold47_00067 [Bacteriophage sp.]|nr:hypothetical protein 1013_scaffold47_00067 [Bacteriophage sp.]